MARVNKSALHQALDELAQGGVISGWQARPLGVYMIALGGGAVLRPDTKETAMWVQGAQHAAAINEVTRTIEQSPDRVSVEALLDGFRSANIIASWQRDSDDDYEVIGRDGNRTVLYATDIGSWLGGAAWGVRQAMATPDWQLPDLAQALDALREMGRISAWLVTDERQYRVWLPGADDPVQLADGRALSHWLQGFAAGGGAGLGEVP